MSIKPLTHLGPLPIAEFFSDYWQKKPLFIKSAFKNLPQLDPDTLAGFSLEEEVESRIITETPTGNDGFNSQWHVSHGPLDEKIFADLPKSHWTLLVQAVNQLDADVDKLLHQFRFIPNWRIDDIMVSFAADKGSVGPHFDYYDVFLLQAHGRRRWQLGQQCNSHTPLQKNCDLKILTAFEATQTFEVEPGDLLYIPPGLAHWGVAQGNSVTYSVGYRAPSYSETLTSLTETLCEPFSDDHRYSDPSLTTRSNPGQITQEDLKRVQNIISEMLDNPAGIAQWFGQAMTLPVRGVLTYEPTPVRQLMPDSRSAYLEANGAAILFVNGAQFVTSLDFAKTLCGYQTVDTHALNQEDKHTWDLLCEHGWATP